MKKNNQRIGNFIDGVVGAVSPERGLRRKQARITMNAVSGFTGASRSKKSLKKYNPAGGDSDSNLIYDLPKLRERSRDLLRNNPIAIGAEHTKVTNVIGSGLKLHSRINYEYLGMTIDEAKAWERKTEMLFDVWASSKNCDITRTNNFYALQEQVFRQQFSNGDAIVTLPYKKIKHSPFGTRLQVIEADRLCNKDDKKDGKIGKGTVSLGVEKDKYGAPVRYHIASSHQRFGVKREWKIIDAYNDNSGLRNVLHIFKQLRPGQTRGIPELAPVIESLKQLARYTESELTAAVVSSFFTVFIKSEKGEGDVDLDIPEDGYSQPKDSNVKLEAGAIIDLARDESIETANPSRPNAQFDPFVVSILRQIGVALELPFEVLIKHFTSSYSAARAAVMEAWRHFKNRRRWIADEFCKPSYEVWMYEAIALGLIDAPGFFEDSFIRAAYLGSEWVGPGQGHIDPVRESTAAEKRLKNKITTLAQETAEYNGNDYDKNLDQIKREKVRTLEIDKIGIEKEVV